MSMRMFPTFAAAAIAVALISHSTSAQGTAAPEWRSSFAAFARALDKVAPKDIPGSKVEAGDLTGARVPSDAPIMQRFGGGVVFEGVFRGVIRPDRQQGRNHGSVVGSPFSKVEKIDIVMTWPEGLDTMSDPRLHLYPKPAALAAWRALKPEAPVRFRAVVTGITRFEPWIPGHPGSISILLEDAEVLPGQAR